MRYKITGVTERGMEHGERLMREVVDEKMDGASTQQEKRKILRRKKPKPAAAESPFLRNR